MPIKPTQNLNMKAKRNQDIMAEVKRYHDAGMNDTDIAILVNRPRSTIGTYRDLYLNLEPRWIRRNYKNLDDKKRGYMLRNLKFSAKRRGIEFNIKYSDIPLPSHCPVLGIPLKYKEFNLERCKYNGPDWATVDRFDNNAGYLPHNIWVISRLANTMKYSSSIEELELFCKSMLKKIENHRALGGVTDSCESRPLVVAPSSPSPDKLGSG